MDNFVPTDLITQMKRTNPVKKKKIDQYHARRNRSSK